MRQTFGTCVFILSLLHLGSSAQPQSNIHFHHFSEQHKLLLFSFSSILQDKKVYMWFRTELEFKNELVEVGDMKTDWRGSTNDSGHCTKVTRE